ncbi:MAG: AIR synthase family protein [Chloroflexota bacterium]
MQRLDNSGAPATIETRAGKIASESFAGVIQPRLGASRSEVLVGPQSGLDAGILDMGGDRVMAVTTDPFFVMPSLGWERAAWFAVHIVASDLCTTGLAPQFCAIDLNLPLNVSDADLATLWEGIDGACRQIGVAIVTGHTGRYEGCAFPTIGSATFMATGHRTEYITPAMARPGDAVLLTKGAGIETAGMFGATFPRQLSVSIGSKLAVAAENLFWQMSVVKDAITAARAGVREAGVSAMHDATERGVWGGLVEMAEASNVGMRIDQGAIAVPAPVRAICDLFDIDPYSTSSEGTLILTARAHRTCNIIRRLEDEGVAAAVIGEVTDAGEGVTVLHDGFSQPLRSPESDPFWPAFKMAMERWPE